MKILIVEIARPRVQCRAYTQCSYFTKQCKHQAEEGLLFCSAHWKDRANLEYYNGSSIEEIIYDNAIAGLSRNVIVEKCEKPIEHYVNSQYKIPPNRDIKLVLNFTRKVNGKRLKLPLIDIYEFRDQNDYIVNFSPSFRYKIYSESLRNYNKKVEDNKKQVLEILKEQKGTCDDTDKLICDYLFLH